MYFTFHSLIEPIRKFGVVYQNGPVTMKASLCGEMVVIACSVNAPIILDSLIFPGNIAAVDYAANTFTLEVPYSYLKHRVSCGKRRGKRHRMRVPQERVLA